MTAEMESPGNEAWVKERCVTRRRFIAYYRVSTRAQGRSGLGLEAQQAAVGRFLQSASGDLFAEFTEVESGTKAVRPQFNEALRLCRIFSAVLVIAKLDRLARNVALIAQLMESGVEFVAADFPQANHSRSIFSRPSRSMRPSSSRSASKRRSSPQRRAAWSGEATGMRQPRIWTKLGALATKDESAGPRRAR
jgi:hypothetical protein